MTEAENKLINTAGQLKDEVDGVGIIISDNIDLEQVRSILLMERGPNVRFTGQLENCGGSLEPGEDPLAAARRELLEELGVEPDEILHLYSYIPLPEESQKQDHIFLATLKGTPRIAEADLGKCSALRWAAIDALDELPLAEYSRYDFIRLCWIKADSSQTAPAAI